MRRAICFVETPQRMAGAQRSLLVSLSKIAHFGWQVTTVFPGEGIVADAYRTAGLDVAVLPAPERLLRFDKHLLRMGLLGQADVLWRDVLPYSLKLGDFARSRGADVLHFNTARGILMAGWAGPLSRRPVVLHVRGATEILGSLKWAVSQALATRIVLVAEALKRSVARRHLDRARVVHNGVEVPDVLPDRASARARLVPQFLKRPIETGEILVLMLSSLTPFKGLHHLLRAANIARASGAMLRYIHAGAVGDAGYARYVQRLAAELGLTEVISIAGYTDDPLSLLAAADVLVLPSVDSDELVLDGAGLQRVTGSEGLPRVILEAMAYAVPVIASEVQGVTEQVVDGVSGRLLTPGDPVALAHALLELANDPAFRARAGAAGRQRAQSRFSATAAAEGLAAVFAETLSQQLSGGPARTTR